MRYVLLLISCFISFESFGKCRGKFLNPISDICWDCLFPISIGGSMVENLGGGEDIKNPSQVVWMCPKKGVPTPCLPIGFWEPVRMVDVTRIPFCMINLGGIKFASSQINEGTHYYKKRNGRRQKHSFYQVHWYVYPVLYVLKVLTDFLCLDAREFDVGWLSEFDPSWNNEDSIFLGSPEAILFGNIVAEAACVADCAKAAFSSPMDSLFWCDGCRGGIYPFSGNIENHQGGVHSSLIITEKIIAKLHRAFLLPRTSGSDKDILCHSQPSPIIKKSQYKLQMIYPTPATDVKTGCLFFGRNEDFLSPNKETPVIGEDFGYLIWRKKNCCAF